MRKYLPSLSGSSIDKRSHILQAARNPINLDDRQIDAVKARIEMDLRIGYAFSRYWTNSLKSLGGTFSEMGRNGKSRVFSYGTTFRLHDIQRTANN